MSVYVSCVNDKRRRMLYASPLREDPPSLTIDIPRDVLISVMKIFARDCVVSYVNIKASCKLLRDAGCDSGVSQCLHCNSIPLFAEEYPSVQRLFAIF